MGSRALWAVAVAVFVGAAAFAYSVYGDSRRPDEAVVEDATGDVVGSAPEEARRLIDIDRVTLGRSGDGYTLVFEMGADVSGPEAHGVVVFTARLTTGSATYNVRARVAGDARDGAVVDVADPDRPFVLEDPKVVGRRVEIRIPDDAVDDLRSPFTWGAAVRVEGAEDKAPADSAAVFPGVRS